MVEAVWNQDMDGCLLVRKGESFIEYEAKVSSRVSSIKWGVMDFGKLFAETNKQKFSIRGVEHQKICCVSVHLSITRRSSTNMAKHRITQAMLHNSTSNQLITTWFERHTVIYVHQHCDGWFITNGERQKCESCRGSKHRHNTWQAGQLSAEHISRAVVTYSFYT